MNDKERWDKLKVIATPKQWLQIHKEYNEMLLNEDVANFWYEQYVIANKERAELLEKLISQNKKK